MKNFYAFICMSAVVVAGCSRSLKTKFYNSTGQTLSNVVISCEGRTNRFSVFPPGSELHLAFNPPITSNSSLMLSFDSATETNDFFNCEGPMVENVADGDWLSVNISTNGIFANFIGKGHMFDQPY